MMVVYQILEERTILMMTPMSARISKTRMTSRHSLLGFLYCIEDCLPGLGPT